MSQNVEKVRPVRVATEMDERLTVGKTGRTGWWQSVWLVPTVAAILGFLFYVLPPYLTFDPKKQNAPINPNVPGLDYAVLVAHILFGTVALLTVCLQIWPWLRTHHPVVHRYSGRLYVFAGALPSAALAIVVNFLQAGWHADVGGYAQAGLLFVTTLIGYVAIRRRQYLKHRRWMLYSFAMSTSIVWGLVIALLQQWLAPKLSFDYIAEASRWAAWLVNVLFIKWWLDFTDRRTRRGVGSAELRDLASAERAMTTDN